MKKTTKLKNNKHKKLSLIGLTILGLLLVAIILVQLIINMNFQNRITKLEVTQFSYMISEPLGAYSKEVVSDPTTGEIYIEEAKIKLPKLPEAISANKLVYEYETLEGEPGAIINLSSKNALSYGKGLLKNASTYERLFEKIPEAQACTRLFTVQLQIEGERYLNEYSEKYHVGTLKDGRKYEIYKNNACNFPTNDLSEFIKNIQSY